MTDFANGSISVENGPILVEHGPILVRNGLILVENAPISIDHGPVAVENWSFQVSVDFAIFELIPSIKSFRFHNIYGSSKFSFFILFYEFFSKIVIFPIIFREWVSNFFAEF